MNLVSVPVQFQNVGASDIAYRKLGSGEPLVFIHGWPISGLTFRKVVPALAQYFTCYVIDLPGAGQSRWSEKTDFSFSGMAESVKQFAQRLGMTSYSLLAHDTGATIARQLAIIDSENVKKLIAIGTEIPNHRPPFIQFMQFMSHVPGFDSISRKRMQSDRFLFSAQGFGECFSNRELIKGEFHDLFIKPMIESKEYRIGIRKRLRGIDWKLVDSLKDGHKKIKAPVLLIWGEDDKTFPVEEAKKMIPQFKNFKSLKVIPNSKLFVQEEKPDLVAKYSLEFLHE